MRGWRRASKGWSPPRCAPRRPRPGVDFGYLLAQARLESGLDPHARARTSSAAGLYQFTTATWLDTVRRHGAAHGLGWAADAVRAGGAAARGAVLALRHDAAASALMAAEFAQDNKASLEARLGRAVDATELYLAHFLGAGGAAGFLAAKASDPGAAAAGIAPAAAAANRGVFYTADGSPRSVAQVFDRFAARLGKAMPEGGKDLPGVVAAGVLAAAPAPTVIPAKAGTHLPQLEEMGPRFRGDDGEVQSGNQLADATADRLTAATPQLAATAAQLAWLTLAALDG